MTTLESSNKTPDSPEKPDICEENTEKIFSVTADGIFSCSNCDYQTGRKHAILRHNNSHIELQKHDTCTICGRIFKTSQSLKKHLITHSWSKPFLCNDCNGCYRTVGELQRHIRYKHTREKPFKCTVCSYAAVERSKLTVHMRGHTGERPYKCPHCTYASNEGSKLKRHLRTHTREHPYKCHICNVDFTRARSLKTHLRRTHSEKPYEYKCDICHAVCPTMFTLEQHLQNLHTYIGLQSCTKCDASFTDRYTLNNHVKTHKRRLKSQCGICQDTSTKTQATHAHHSHSMLECEKCDSCFTSQAKLSQLVKEHHNTAQKHVCNKCGKSYPTKRNLVRHMKINCNSQVSSKTCIQDTNNDSADLSAITRNLKIGEVIVLPVKGGENYLLIEILSDGINCSHPKMKAKLTSSAKDEILKDFDVETENDSLEIKLEVESDIDMTDEDEKPFFGF